MNDDKPDGDDKDGKQARDGSDDGRRRAAAVALSYDPETTAAPKVVAGGRGAVAEQIVALAFAHGVRVREDADLAEMLSAIDVDSEIPVEAFIAVAEILAYVYRANGSFPSAFNEVKP